MMLFSNTTPIRKHKVDDDNSSLEAKMTKKIPIEIAG